MTDPAAAEMLRQAGPVAVIGAGLLGTSVALACRRAGLEVLLEDVSARHVRTARGLGAGRLLEPEDRPALVVVAVPPVHVAAVVRKALHDHPTAVVTDVASIKGAVLDAIASEVSPTDLSRYVGSHPMAGSERSGPLAATAALFDGRPWAVTPHTGSSDWAREAATALATACGAVVIAMAPEDHDRAVARTSHLPHLSAVLVASRLADAAAGELALSGQGVRDVTRVAASDPGMWLQILSANAEAVMTLLQEVRSDLDGLIAALGAADEPALTEFLRRGNAGTAAIPGKHGGPARPTTSVVVAISDAPGELARLFADVGDSGVNIEDVYIDHDPGRPGGRAELVVAEESARHLSGTLESRGWAAHG